MVIKESILGIEFRSLSLSQWYKWSNRKNYSLRKYPGVYCISITIKENLEGTDVHLKDVVYIGMTNSRGGLQSRWRQFYNSIRGKSAHSGGNTIFKDLGHFDTWQLQLYVAAMGIKVNTANPTADDYRKMGMVAYLEYEAFAQYYKAIDGHPTYNTR